MPPIGETERLFRWITQQYGKPLYWHIRRIVVGHDDAEDVLQEAFISIFTHLRQLNNPANMKPWLYRIATNEALQHLRRQTRLFQSIDSLSQPLTEKLHAETALDADAAEALFHEALLQLPTMQRISFNLRYYDEMDYAEISAVTGKSINTLKTNYHYATQRIRKYINEHTQ